jgi:hypothetical protein
MALSFQEREDEVNHPVLQRHRNILKKMNDDRVMCVCYDNEKNNFSIMECCDEWFYHYLTKEECFELSEMFKEIAEAIEN